jgi:phi13 family phage major tail protein
MAIMGLESVVIAPQLTDVKGGTATYGEVTQLIDAVNVKMTPTIDEANLFGDNAVAEIIKVFSQCDVDFEQLELLMENYRAISGAQKDSNGVTMDNGDDIAPYFAMGFKFKKTNKKFRYYWLLKGKFSAVEEEASTETDKAEATTQQLKATFIKRKCDGNWRFKVDEDEEGLVAGVLDTWFDKVYEKNALIS